jgi:hypothetical protein
VPSLVLLPFFVVFSMWRRTVHRRNNDDNSLKFERTLVLNTVMSDQAAALAGRARVQSGEDPRREVRELSPAVAHWDGQCRKSRRVNRTV